MSMIPTTWQDIRNGHDKLLEKYEVRGSDYALFAKGLQNAQTGTGIISPEVLQNAKRTWGRNIEIPVMSPASQANGTGISCAFVGTEAVSDLVGINWFTLSNGFEMQKAKNWQNDIPYEDEWMRKYRDAKRRIALAADQLVDTTLTASITPAAQYSSTLVGAGNRYPFVGDVMQCALANRDDYFNDVPDIFMSDDLYPRFDVLSSTNGRGMLKKIGAQGAQNAVNTAYQFVEGDFNYMFSNRVTTTPGSLASMFIMPEGAYGIVTRVRPDCEMGTVTTKGHEFGVIRDERFMSAPNDEFTIDVGTLYYSDCTGITDVTGNPLDTTGSREYHQFEIMIGLMVPYTNFATSGNSSVIRKVDFLNV